MDNEQKCGTNCRPRECRTVTRLNNRRMYQQSLFLPYPLVENKQPIVPSRAIQSHTLDREPSWTGQCGDSKCIKEVKGWTVGIQQIQNDRIKYEYKLITHRRRSAQCNLEAGGCHVIGYESSRPEEVTVELPWRRRTPPYRRRRHWEPTARL